MILIKLKLWLRRRLLERKLERYVSTLSPAQQDWANGLQRRLQAARTPAAKREILLSNCNTVSESLHRLTEKLDALQRRLDV